MRTLHFTLEIETELDEGDEEQPTIEYVTDWLNQNGYGYRYVGQYVVPIPEVGG